jgi:hypothetical protein
MSHMQSSPAIKNPHDRVRNHSPKESNKEIDKKMDYIIKTTIEKGAFAIRERLLQLDKEWDIDRALLAFFSSTLLVQLGFAVKKKSHRPAILPLIQSAFIFMHSTYGWCPPVPVLRSLGFRTRFEIQSEREELLNALINLESEHPGKKIIINEWDIYGSI